MKKVNEKYLELVEIAERARELSYSPYSGISVGCALLTSSGRVYTGANIENAAYTPTVCAERTAIFAAVLAGEREFSAIAVAGGKRGEGVTDGFFPCGVCRQVLSEFASPELVVLTAKEGGYDEYTLGELLPAAFTKDKV